MKKAKSVGLIASGNLTGSPLARFERLSENLGPVKSTSFRLASRVANLLRAGHPVKDYAEFETCTLILVCVPDDQVQLIVAELLATQTTWRGKAVVLCSEWLDAGELRDLAARGASVGSLSPIPGFDHLYLLEGERLAILVSKRLIEDRVTRTVSIGPPLKPLYLAALNCTGSLLFALLLVASEALRHAEISPGLRATLLTRQLDRTVRAFLKGGRRAWPTPQELPGQFRALAAKDPRLAHYLEQSSRLAARLLEGS